MLFCNLFGVILYGKPLCSDKDIIVRKFSAVANSFAFNIIHSISIVCSFFTTY